MRLNRAQAKLLATVVADGPWLVHDCELLAASQLAQRLYITVATDSDGDIVLRATHQGRLRILNPIMLVDK